MRERYGCVLCRTRMLGGVTVLTLWCGVIPGIAAGLAFVVCVAVAIDAHLPVACFVAHDFVDVAPTLVLPRTVNVLLCAMMGLGVPFHLDCPPHRTPFAVRCVRLACCLIALPRVHPALHVLPCGRCGSPCGCCGSRCGSCTALCLAVSAFRVAILSGLVV